MNNIYDNFIYKINPIYNDLSKYLFKKINIKKHIYLIEKIFPYIEKKENKIYYDLIDNNGILESITSFSNITYDFLTGYLLYDIFIKRNIDINLSNRILFFGANKKSFINGIYSHHKNYREIFDCYNIDINSNNKKIYKMDISIIDNIIKFKNNLFKYDQNDKFILFISDIYPKNIKNIYSSLLISMLNINGFSIIRFFNLEDWNKNITYIYNIISFIISTFNEIYLFKTPWDNKCYIIINKYKNNIKNIYTKMIKFLENDNEIQLLNKEFFNDYNINNIINNIYNFYLKDETILSIDYINTLWIDKISI